MLPGGDHERFRNWLGRKLRRNRGLATVLAKRFSKERNWAGRVAKGGSDIPFATACRLASMFHASLADTTKTHDDGHESITLPIAIIDALNDKLIMGAVEALAQIENRSYVTASVQVLRGAAHLPPVPLTDEPNTETRVVANTTRAVDRRRSGPGSKGRGR